MISTRFARITTVLALGFILSMVEPALLPAAQFQNPFRAIKDAYEKAKQQAEQQQARRNGNESSSQAASQQPSDQAGGPVTDSECCTVAAMQKYAKRASVLDIVGIKLGMTTQQAFAAVHVFDPKLKIDIIKRQMEVPGVPESQYPWVPDGAVAHTVGAKGSVNLFRLPDGSSDIIEIQFTTPPNPPLVEAVRRTVNFPLGHPVFASTLLTALRKKYGQVNPDAGGAVTWIYGPDGQLLQRQLTHRERNCPGAASIKGFSVSQSSEEHNITYPIRWDKYANARSYNISNGYPNGDQRAFEIPACLPFTIAKAGADFMSPKAQNVQVTVTIGRAALSYAAFRSTQEWMEVRAEAAQKKEEQSVQKNAAPKF